MKFKEQLEQHYRDNYESSVKYVSRLAGGIENAEDIVQESYTRALQYQEGFHAFAGDLESWMKRIMMNCTKAFKNDERRQGAVNHKEEAEESYELDLDERREALTFLHKEINKRSGKTGEVLKLYYLLDFKYIDIGRVVNLSPSAVGSLLSRFKGEFLRDWRKFQES